MTNRVQPMTARPYRPSNGTEGCWFQAEFCENCHRDREYQESGGNAPGCEILLETMIHDIGEPEYPREWITGGGAGPRCTAYRPIDGPPPRPADLPGQLVMFNLTTTGDSDK